MRISPEQTSNTTKQKSVKIRMSSLSPQRETSSTPARPGASAGKQSAASVPDKKSSERKSSLTNHKSKKDSKDKKLESQTPRSKSPVKISSPKAIHEVSLNEPKKLCESILADENIEGSKRAKTSKEDQASDGKDGDVWNTRLGQLTDHGFVQKVTPKEKVIICPPENLAWVKQGKKCFVL